MKKRFLLFMITSFLIVPFFFVGFALYDFQNPKAVEDKNIELPLGLEEEIQRFTNDDLPVQDDTSQREEKSAEKNEDALESSLYEEEINLVIEEVLDDPEVIDTLASVATQLDDVRLDLEEDSQREIVSIAQESINTYTKDKQINKKNLSHGLEIYNRLSTNEQNEMLRAILSNVSLRDLLFLKKQFGY